MAYSTTLTAIWGSSLLFSLLFALAAYVFSGLGMYRMAHNTGLGREWMAWVPFCREYLLGSLADRWEQGCRSRVTHYRYILLGLTVVPLLLELVAFAQFTSVVTGWIVLGGSYPGATLVGLLVTAGLLGLLAIVQRVVYLIAYYKTMRDFEPSRAGIYTLGALLGFGWLFLFFCRNNVPVGIAGRQEPNQPRYDTFG